MQEFEKWWKVATVPHGASLKEKLDAKDGWRAALEWAKSESIYDRVECGIIEEELND